MTIGTVIIGVLAMNGCDRNARGLVPEPSDAYPGVIEIGELNVITADDLLGDSDVGRYLAPSVCEDEEAGLCYFGQLGQPKDNVKGGATFTFKGTGDEVCLVVDPESVFWGASISPAQRFDNFAWPDNYSDDGDIDLFGGLSSYYTGSPGVELGDFKGFYTDSRGNEVVIEYGECKQAGGQIGFNDAHAGRGTEEYCTIDTAERVGIDYTVVLETFSVPLDDGILSFGVMVLEGSCSQLGVDECTILGESLSPETGETRSCSTKREIAMCTNQVAEFCCANPEMCGSNGPDDLCELYFTTDAGRTAWCDDSGLCCDDDE